MSSFDSPITLLSDAAFLNRVIYGGEHLLQDPFLDDYDQPEDPDKVGAREALNVYDRYDLYLAQFGFTVLSSSELGFAPSEISASDMTDGLDRNFTYDGGLWRNNFQQFEDGSEVAFTDAGAVAMVAVKPGEDGDTLHLVFRGTDADLGADGEAGTAAGQARYYRQLKPLIDQVFDYASDPANGVTGVVVSGQSLGGQMADIFTLYDSSRFEALAGVDLQVVSLASAGIEPGLFALMPGYDPARVQIDPDGSVSSETPEWYLQYAHAEDIVYFPERYDAGRHAETDPEQAPITAAATSSLRDHVHFEGNLIEVLAPQVPQYELSPDFETNFLAQHYPSFYGLTGQAFAEAGAGVDVWAYDAHVALYGLDPDLFGVSGNNNVNGWGLPENDDVDYSADPVLGTADVFIFGMSGDDRIATGSGDDLLAGGSGADTLLGGGGDDFLRGGEGADLLDGGGANDRYEGGAGSDVFRIGAGATVETVLDFEDGSDRIDLSDNAIFTKWSAVRKSASETPAGVEIEKDGQTLLLSGVDLSDLDKGDFLF